MPVYAYQCDNCGVQFERTQKFTDPPVTRCPECRKKTVRKLLASPSIVFKGSGWYATDHRSPSGQSRIGKKDEAKSGEKSGETTEAKTDSKSESQPSKSSGADGD
ncbi:MAG: zinc ribbon domain-containing protein [Chloroflexi bacterium]|nr:zinc ribbon domain-containing protein [Chloroflexota bacterium]